MVKFATQAGILDEEMSLGRWKEIWSRCERESQPFDLNELVKDFALQMFVRKTGDFDREEAFDDLCREFTKEWCTNSKWADAIPGLTTSKTLPHDFPTSAIKFAQAQSEDFYGMIVENLERAQRELNEDTDTTHRGRSTSSRRQSSSSEDDSSSARKGWKWIIAPHKGSCELVSLIPALIPESPTDTTMVSRAIQVDDLKNEFPTATTPERAVALRKVDNIKAARVPRLGPDVIGPMNHVIQQNVLCVRESGDGSPLVLSQCGQGLKTKDKNRLVSFALSAEFGRVMLELDEQVVTGPNSDGTWDIMVDHMYIRASLLTSPFPSKSTSLPDTSDPFIPADPRDSHLRTALSRNDLDLEYFEVTDRDTFEDYVIEMKTPGGITEENEVSWAVALMGYDVVNDDHGKLKMSRVPKESKPNRQGRANEKPDPDPNKNDDTSQSSDSNSDKPPLQRKTQQFGTHSWSSKRAWNSEESWQSNRWTNKADSGASGSHGKRSRGDDLDYAPWRNNRARGEDPNWSGRDGDGWYQS